jgi:hypothetical protein
VNVDMKPDDARLGALGLATAIRNGIPVTAAWDDGWGERDLRHIALQAALCLRDLLGQEQADHLIGETDHETAAETTLRLCTFLAGYVKVRADEMGVTAESVLQAMAARAAWRHW